MATKATGGGRAAAKDRAHDYVKAQGARQSPRHQLAPTRTALRKRRGMATRNRRAGVEDLWTKSIRDDDGNTKALPSARHGRGMRWRARYVDERGREHTKAFTRKVDAQKWLDSADGGRCRRHSRSPTRRATDRAAVVRHVDQGLQGQPANPLCGRRKSISARIVAEFGGMPLSAVRPSQVKAWIGRSCAPPGWKPSYVYALHSRLSQIMSDAVHDGVLGRNPCSRRTSPPMGKAKVYVGHHGTGLGDSRSSARPHAGRCAAGRIRRAAGR